MPRETGASNRLSILFNSLLSGRGTDPADTLDRISRLLTPERGAAGLRQFSRLLREAGPLTAETCLGASCIMHMGGMPAHRIVQFLALSLPGGISLSQFELAARFMFGSVPPLPESLLYDLTRYTYLERRLLVQRSVELSERLTKSMTPEMLLYLYLLSLREDLSNENVHLILLILRICFPALKIPRTARGITPAEEGEIAEAWKNAERSARYAEALGTPALRARREDRAARESASFFLDKYFADDALEEQPETGTAPATGTWTAPISAAARAARTGAAKASASGSAAEGVTSAGARPRGRAKKQAAPAHRRLGLSRRSPRALPRKNRGSPAAAAQPLPPSGSNRVGAGGRLRLAAPFGIAAVLLLAVVVADHRIPEWKGLRTRPASLQAATAPQPGTQQATAPQPEAQQAAARPASRFAFHRVQEGDNLWKIYRSLHSEGMLDTGWKDFLLRVTERNGLQDPDAIFPGNVLTITTVTK